MDGSIHGRYQQSPTGYPRRDALRILQLNARQVAHWERVGLIRVSEHYSFEELGQLRTLRELRATRISAKSIHASLRAMERLTGASRALGESSAVCRGSRLVFRHGGALVDPKTLQLALDFEAGAREPLYVAGAREPLRRSFAIQEMFVRAVRLEESEATRPEAAELYASILMEQPNHAASAINLGTIRFGQREFAEAERLYRRATEADPEYALAFFDLGNVLDELKRLDEAIAAYLRAIALMPDYADAHYNVALAYERQGERRRALRHWLRYVRLDPVGPWANHAKVQAKKILGSERLTIVSRRGRLVAAS